MGKNQALSQDQLNELLSTLQTRFENNKNRHPEIDWQTVETKLRANPDKLLSLHQMEHTGGEPDLIAYDANSGEYHFCDCSAESPAGRRSVCYDRAGLESRKEHRPENTAVDMADEMNIDLLSEEQYRNLQKLGKFDTKTSSWIKAPADIRKLGGGLFAEFRYGNVFVYHNGAQSYYAARGFRGLLKV